MNNSEIYIMNIERVKSVYEKADRILTSERFDKFKRYKKEEDRLRCLASGILLNKYIGKEEIKHIKYNNNGKPYIENKKQFNISHSGEYVVLAVDEKQVGIDIEKIEKRDVNKIINRVCCDEEKKYIKESSDIQKAFYEIWTLKESYVKWEGKGFSIEPKSIAFKRENEKFFLKSNRSLNFYVNEIDVERYIISICTQSNNYKISQINHCDIFNC